MNSENSAHQAVRFQDAQAMYYQGQLGRRKDAAVIAEMAPHIEWPVGDQRRTTAKTRRLLTAEEESILIWRCDVLQCPGWSQAPEDVRILALETV